MSMDGITRQRRCGRRAAALANTNNFSLGRRVAALAIHFYSQLFHLIRVVPGKDVLAAR